MNKELQQKLFDKFPTIYQLGKTPQDYFYWGIECGNGWFKLLWKLSEDLEKAGFEGQVTQVKEKYGSLRFYTTGADDVSQFLIDYAEEESGFICEICGRKGKLRDYGWLTTLCWFHYLKIMRRKM